MFTGIIETKGSIVSVAKGAKGSRLTINAKGIMDDVKPGDSIAVNGVCLTAAEIKGDTFTADVMEETLRRSNLGSLKPGSEVNLERAMAAGGRFGGHIVSGHIDGTGTITSFVNEGNAIWVTVEAPASILNLIVEKGSIAIDGISLTVAYIDSKCFKVSIIPHTSSETTLTSKKVGDKVNLENDIIGKYVEKLMGLSGDGMKTGNGSSSLTKSKLFENGFI